MLACPAPGDIFNWFNPLNPLGAAQLRDAMVNLISTFAWYDLCECADATHPAAPAPCGAPATVEPVPPALVPPILPSSCASNNQPSSVFGASPHTDNVFAAAAFTANPTASSVEVAIVTTLTTQDVTVTLNLRNAGGAVLQAYNAGVIASGGTGLTATVSVPFNCASIDLVLTWAGAMGGTARYSWNAGLFCANALPNVPAVACCPPDPTALSMLQQIIRELDGLRNMLPIRAPSYSVLNVSAGLAGNGEVNLQPDTIRVDTLLTTIPPYLGVEGGDTPEYFNVGRLEYYDGTGNVELGRIRFQLQSFETPLGGALRVISYTLSPLVIMSLYEYAAGPTL